MPPVTQQLRFLLQEQLRVADARDRDASTIISGSDDFIDVPTVGKTVSSAYEQLRNAADNAEEHLLLQRAIKRFYRLNVFTTKRDVKKLNLELISELVLAGYLQNNTVSKRAIEQLDAILARYLQAFDQLIARGARGDQSTEYVLSCLSSDIESLIRPHNRQQALIAVAYQYFSKAIDREQYNHLPDNIGYELCLYIAAHQALLKSDVDIVRADVRVMYSIDPTDSERFLQINQQVDHYFSCRLTSELRRNINRNGSPLRVLKSLITSRPDLPDLLSDQRAFLDAFRFQAEQDYVQVNKKLNTGLAKSVAFVFITKMLIGLAIEIPFDFQTRGQIVWIPLLINLLFPPVYMILLRLGIQTPKPRNTEKLMQLINEILYGNEVAVLATPAHKKIKPAAQVIYDLLFSVPIAITIAILYALDFNIVQMIIFFIFFSTASSLGFRLRAMVTDLEVNRHNTGLLVSIRDFLYLPFIVFGQWISAEYRRFNIIGRMLDIIIELPLKTFFRLARQWMRFLDEQNDRLY